jgi:hypothetical protein
MTLARCSPSEYQIDTPGFDQTIFTVTSRDYLPFPVAVQYARVRNSVLQSARDAIAFRIAANGAEGANDYQLTRTAAVYFREHGQHFVAFDDDPADNLLLARSTDGTAAYRVGLPWLARRANDMITRMLDRAQHADRIHPLPRQDETIYSTTGSTAAYATAPMVRAMIGDLAAPYADFLGNKGHTRGRTWLLTPKDVQRNVVTDDFVEVRRVGVGGEAYLMYGLDADGRCNGTGRARGVRDNRKPGDC